MINRYTTPRHSNNNSSSNNHHDSHPLVASSDTGYLPVAVVTPAVVPSSQQSIMSHSGHQDGGGASGSGGGNRLDFGGGTPRSDHARNRAEASLAEAQISGSPMQAVLSAASIPPKELEWVRNPGDGSVLVDHNGKPVSVDRILNTKPLKADLCTRPGPGGKKLTYMSGEGVSRTLNDVFGFDGWDLDISRVQREECLKDDKTGRFHVVYTAHVRLTHKASGSYKEDCGAGDSVDKSFATAVAHALKASITDAMKRAARHFGDKLGNSLYQSNFSISKAPLSLKDALDKYDIERANAKFGFAKDRKQPEQVKSREQVQAQGQMQVSASLASHSSTLSTPAKSAPRSGGAVVSQTPGIAPNSARSSHRSPSHGVGASERYTKPPPNETSKPAPRNSPTKNQGPQRIIDSRSRLDQFAAVVPTPSLPSGSSGPNRNVASLPSSNAPSHRQGYGNNAPPSQKQHPQQNRTDLGYQKQQQTNDGRVDGANGSTLGRSYQINGVSGRVAPAPNQAPFKPGEFDYGSSLSSTARQPSQPPAPGQSPLPNPPGPGRGILGGLSGTKRPLQGQNFDDASAKRPNTGGASAGAPPVNPYRK